MSASVKWCLIHMYVKVTHDAPQKEKNRFVERGLVDSLNGGAREYTSHVSLRQAMLPARGVRPQTLTMCRSGQRKKK